MKANVKETGKEFKVRGILTPTADAYAIEEVDLFFDESDQVELLYREDYWARLEHQYAGMAMQQLVHLVNVGYEYVYEETAIIAMNFAHALIQKLKEKEGRK